VSVGCSSSATTRVKVPHCSYSFQNVNGSKQYAAKPNGYNGACSVSILEAVALFCIDVTIGAFIGRAFKNHNTGQYAMRDNLFCEPCLLEGRRVVAEKIYHMALVKPPVGDVAVCLRCAGSMRRWDGRIIDIADA
jgi:hypothetical protein